MACHGEAHDHDHDHSKPEDAEGDSLFQYIDTTKLRVLNASDASTVSIPFRPWHLRQMKDQALDSNEDDPELILFIPFTESVTIKSICLSGGTEGTHPKRMKMYKHR